MVRRPPPKRCTGRINWLLKCAHAAQLADAGLSAKARRYMTLPQTFVKAVPQSRLSDAFLSSTREFTELLTPSLETLTMGALVKDLFRGIARTTGLAAGTMPPPNLPDDCDDKPP